MRPKPRLGIPLRILSEKGCRQQNRFDWQGFIGKRQPIAASYQVERSQPFRFAESPPYSPTIGL